MTLPFFRRNKFKLAQNAVRTNKRPSFRVSQIESLEERVVPATLYWLGTNSSDWAGDNWTATSGSGSVDGSVVNSGDTLVFDTQQTNFNIATFNNTNSLGALTGLALVINDASASGDFNIGGTAIATGAGGIASTVSQGTAATLSFDTSGITLGSAQTFTSNAGTLVVSAAVANGANLLTIDGAGDTSFTSSIGNGAGGLTKNGVGSLRLSAANTYTGGTTINAGVLQLSGAGSLVLSATTLSVNGGTFIIDNTTAAGGNNNARLADTQSITMNGGAFEYKGADAAATNSSETVGNIIVGGTGQSRITITYGGTNTATVSGALLYRVAGNATLLVNGLDLGKDSSSTSSVSRLLMTSVPFLSGGTPGAATGINANAMNTQIVPFLVGESATASGGTGTATGNPNTFVTFNSTTGLRPLNPTDEFLTNNISPGMNVRVTSATSATASAIINSLIIDGGNLSIDDGVNLTTPSGSTLFAQTGAIAATGTTGRYTFANEGLITSAAGANATISAVLDGAGARGNNTGGGFPGQFGGVVKSGPGSLTLNGNNKYVGLTTVAAGTLNAGVANAFGPGSIRVSGGTLNIGAFNQTIGSLTLTSGSIVGSTGILTMANAPGAFNVPSIAVESGTIGAILAGNVTLTKSTSGTVTINSANVYTGTTTVSAGVLVAATTGALGTGATAVSGGTLIVAAVNALSSGALTVNSGTLDLGANNVSVGAATLTAGTITGTSGVLTASSFELQSGAVRAILGGAGTITKSTAGSVVLTGSNSLTGATTVNAGTLQLSGANGSLALSAGGITVNSGGTFAIDNTTTAGGNNNDRLHLSQSLILNGGTFLYNGTNAAATNSTESFGAITLGDIGQSTITINFGGTNVAEVTAASLTRDSGKGTLFVNGTNLGLNDSATSSVARLKLSTAPTLVGTTPAAAVGIQNGVTDTEIVPFLVGASSPVSMEGGTASSTPNTFVTFQSGTGLRPLNPVNEFEGNTIVAGKNIRLASTPMAALASTSINSLILAGQNLTIDDTAALTVASGAVQMASSGATIQPQLTAGTLAFGTAEGIITANTGVTATISAIVSGNGGLSLGGPGTLSLTNANAFSGQTSVLGGGTLTVTTAGSLSSAGNLAVNGTLSIGTNTYSVGAVTLYGGTITGSTGTLTGTSYAVQSGNVEAILAGLGVGLTKSTSGTVTLTRSNTFTGPVAINAGTASFATGGLGVGGNISFAGGTLQFATGNVDDISGRIKNSSSAVSLDTNANNVSFGSSIDNTNANGLTKLGNGTLTLNAANDYVGQTTVTAGSIAAGSPGAGSIVAGIAGAIPANNILMNGGTLDIGAFNHTVGVVTMTSGLINSTGGGVLTASSYLITNGGTINANLAGSNGLTKTGGGTLTLNGINTYTGAINLVTGTITVRRPESLGVSDGSVANGIVIGPFAQLSFGSDTDTPSTTFFTISEHITSNGGVIQANAASGSAHVNLTGPVLLGERSTTAFTFRSGSNGEFRHRGVISGTGNAVFRNAGGGGGTHYLHAVNEYSGITVLTTQQTSLRPINLESTSPFGNGSGLVVVLGDFNYNASLVPTPVAVGDLFAGISLTIPNNIITINQGLTINVSTGLTVTASGMIGQDANRTLTKSGGGELILNNPNSIIGAVSTTGGFLTVGVDSTPTSGTVLRGPVGLGTLNLNGGELRAGGGTRTLSNTVNLAGNSSIGGTNTLILTSPITGTSTLTKTGSMTLELPVVSTAATPIVVALGTLKLTGAGQISAGSLTVIPGGIVLIDNSATNLNNRELKPITLSGGSFNMSPSTSATVNETTGNLTIGAGNSIVTNTADPLQESNLIFGTGTTTRNTGGIVLFRGTSMSPTGAGPAVGTATIGFTVAPSFIGRNGATGSIEKAILPWALVDLTESGLGIGGFATTNSSGPFYIRPLLASEQVTNSLSSIANVVYGIRGAATGTLLNSINLSAGAQIYIAPTASLTLDSGGLISTAANSGFMGGFFNTSSNREIILHAAGDFPINSIVGNAASNFSGGLTKSSAGTVTLGRINNYTGQTTINQGTLILAGGNNTLDPNRALVVNSEGTLNIGANRQYVGSLSSTNGLEGFGGIITGSGTLTSNNGGATTFGGSLQGSLNFVKVGGNALTLTDANTTTGSFTVLGNTATLTDGGTLENISGLNLRYGSLVVTNLGALNIANRVNDTAPILIAGGNLTYNGRGETNTPEALGGLTVAAGRSTITVNAGVGGIAQVNVATFTRDNGSFLNLIGQQNNVSGNTTLGRTGNSPRLIVDGTAPALTNGVVPGVSSNGVELVGYVPGLGFGALGTPSFPSYTAGTGLNINTIGANDNYRMTGSETLTATKAINGLAIIGNTNLLFTAGTETLTIGSGMLLKSGDNGNTFGTTAARGLITSGLSELFIANNQNTLTVHSQITGTGVKAIYMPVGGITLTANNTHTGGTVVNGGTLTLNVTTGGSVAVPNATTPSDGLVINNATVTMSTNAGQIGSSNIITLNGGSTMTFTGNNTIAGLVFNSNGGTGTPTVSPSGILTLSGDVTVTPSNVAVTPSISGGTLNLGASGQRIFDVSSLADNAAASSAGTVSNLTITSTLTGGAGLTKSGNGVLNLNGGANSTYSGPTIVSGGVLRASHGNSIPGGLGVSGGLSNIELNGGVLEMNNTSLARNLGTGVAQFQITGGTSGFSAVGGARTVTVNNAAATEVQWGSSTFNPTTLVLNEATANNTLGFANRIDLNGATRTVAVNASHSVAVATISNIVRDAVGAPGVAGLTKTGIGTLVLSAANTYTGPTTVSGGILRSTTTASSAGVSGAFGNNSAVSVVNDVAAGIDIAIATQIGSLAGGGASGGNTSISANLTIGGAIASPTTYAGVIFGAGGVTRTGSGVQIFTGANLYTGNTTVTTGTLSISNSTGSGTGSGTVAVGVGGTLAGNGIISGAVNVNGTVAPGNSAAQTLTVNNNLTLIAGSTSDFEVTKGGGAADKIVGVTAMTYAGALKITGIGGGSFAPGDSWDLFDFTSQTGSFTNTFGNAGDGVNLPILDSGTWQFDNATGVLSIALAAPTVISINPVIGPTTGGTLVTIIGSSFTSITSVTFDGFNAATFTVISATEISAVTAAHGVGVVDVVVTNTLGSDSLTGPDGFTFAPSVASVVVNGGPGVVFGASTFSLAGQHSVVKQILVTFQEDVTVAADAFTVTRRTQNVTVNGGAAPSTVPVIANSVSMLSNSEYLVTFSGTGTHAGGVIDSGVYDLTTIASKVTVGAQTMAADQTTTFFAMFGNIEANNRYNGVTITQPIPQAGYSSGNGLTKAFVDPGSLFQFSDTFGSHATAPAGPPPYNIVFDFNLDGAIDPGDLFAFSDSFGIDWNF